MTTKAKPGRAKKLAEFHGFRNSVRWRLTPRGLQVEGKGIERTPGRPVTVTNVWEDYADHVNSAAKKYGVPCHLIVATICTESRGKADAIRLEPGFVSDAATPHQVSPGLMQTLISTARSALDRPGINRRWLLKPRNSIHAGTAYIAQQSASTKLDPPLVACAYNAGSLRHNNSPANRWKLVQFPIGTSEHCDRFVKFFNDAVHVLGRHEVEPAVGLEALLGDAGRRPPKPRPPAPKKPPKAPAASVTIAFGPSANRRDLRPHSRRVLTDILRAAGLRDCTITSTSRKPADQARVMFQNLELLGVASQKALYGPFGDQVIDVFAQGKRAGRSAARIQLAMERKIVELGPGNVSRHAADPKVLNVFDIAPTSIRNPRAFERAARKERGVSKLLTPPNDPGFHLEIPQ